MVIFLTGATEGTRGIIVDRFLTDHAEWRHLELENFRPETVDTVSPEFFALLIASEATKEAAKSGLHIILSADDASPQTLDTIRGEFLDPIVTVHLGSSLAALTAYDHVVDTATHSLEDASQLLHTVATH
jgi:hypothetical protein